MGGWGEAWGGGPWRAGKGGDGEQQKVHWWPMEGGEGGEMGGGAPESSVGAIQGGAFLGSLQNPTTGLIWLVTRGGGWGKAWGGGPWRAGKGGDGGGHQRAVWEQQKCTGSSFGLP